MKLFATTHAAACLLVLSWASSSTAQSSGSSAIQAMSQARNVIATMVKANPRLTPEFLRMGFHDCVGGCDGCIDLSNPDNNGLAHPISVLEPVVAQYATPATGLGRADVWAVACMVAADVANHGKISQPISFTQNWYGRVDCEKANSVCRNGKGQNVPCSATAGPHRVLPSTKFDSPTVFKYFYDNFGFTERQTVAIMGAHSCGHMLKNESGVDGDHGWTRNNVDLANNYYISLLGAVNSYTPESQLTALSPNWEGTFDDNSEIGLPSVHYWELDIEDNVTLVMLNSDVSMVRDLNETNVEKIHGNVSCTMNSNMGSPVCPIRKPTINYAVEFAGNNDRWLAEFKATYDLMLTNGYKRLPCYNSVCPLTPIKPIQTPPPTTPPTKAPTAPPAMCSAYWGDCSKSQCCSGTCKSWLYFWRLCM